MLGFEAMLGGVGVEGGFKKRQEESFKDFDCGTKEGDGTVGGTKVRGFSRFEEGNNNGGFPERRNVCMLKGKVKKFG